MSKSRVKRVRSASQPARSEWRVPRRSGAAIKRALVMDDQEGLRRLFGRMLERAGFEVVGPKTATRRFAFVAKRAMLAKASAWRCST